MATYRITEAAEVLGVSDDTIRRWIEAGRVPAESDHGPVQIQGRDLAHLAESMSGTLDSERTRAGSVSARNRLTGIVTRVKQDGVMAQVEMVCGPFRMTSLLSADAVADLGLEPGVLAIASVKSTSVVVERSS